MQIAKLETAAEHFAQSGLSLLKGLIHIVSALAPVAEVVGAAVGQPEVAAAAKLAEATATAADAALEKVTAGG
jgi:hypothetical protein